MRRLINSANDPLLLLAAFGLGGANLGLFLGLVAAKFHLDRQTLAASAHEVVLSIS